MHQPTNGKPAPILFFVFSSRDMTDTMIRKSAKVTTTCLNKKGGGLSACFHIRFKYEVKNSDRNSQNRAGHRTINNATCSHHYLFNVQESFLGHNLLGDELGSATDIDRLLVS